MPSSAVTKEWFLCSATSMALFAVCIIMPALSPVVLLICPFPQILLTYERGVPAGMLSAIAVACSIFLAFLAVPSVIYFITFGLSGVLLGQIARKSKGVDMLLGGIFCSLGCKLAAAYFLYKTTGLSLLAPDPSAIEQTLLSLVESRLAPLSGTGAIELRDNIAKNVRNVIMLIPFSLITFSSLEVFFSYVLSSKIHRSRSGDAFFTLPPFARWSFPRNVVVALAVGLVCEFAARGRPGAYFLAQVSANLGMITWTLFAIQGLSVAYYFMEMHGFPKIIRVAIIVLTPIVQLLGSIFSIVGIIDIGFDLRKRARRRQP
ncbi:MAG: YybS family protein [Synergistaceae bacterium]|nr:YybS family protein [Synergistaceae bacterium]